MASISFSRKVLFPLVLSVASSLPLRADTIPTFNWGIPAPPPNLASQLDQVTKLLQGGDHEAAIGQLKAITAAHEQLPPAHILVARWFLATGQPGPMRNMLEQAVVEVPQDPEPYSMLADLALQNGQLFEAEALYRRAVELAGKTLDASGKTRAERIRLLRHQSWGGLAAVAEIRQDWAQVELHLTSLLVEDPKNVAALRQLAHAVFRQGRTDEAYPSLKAAFTADPQGLAAEVSMAGFCQQAGRFEDGRKWLKTALQQNARDVRARLIGIDLALASGSVDEARQHAENIAASASGSYEAEMAQGLVDLVSGSADTAVKHFERAHLLSPGNFSAANHLANALVESADADLRRRALELAELNARSFPDQPESWGTLGWILYRHGRVEEAVRAFGKIPLTNGISADTAYWLARALTTANRQPEARQVVKQVLEPALKSPAVIRFRKDAEALVKELEK